MRTAIRSIVVAVCVLLATVLMAVVQTMTAVAALAATALIMGGTGHPLSEPPDTGAFITGYLNDADNSYISPSGLCTGGNPGCTLVAVVTPEQFVPVSGSEKFDQSVAEGVANLDNCIHGNACTTNPAGTPLSSPFVVYGYSQSATIAMTEKKNLAASDPNAPVSFIVLANANRPDGGVLARSPFGQLTIPFVGVTFNGPAVTDTNFTTVDVARQYDGIGDAPEFPINLLADLNAVLGYVYLHGDYWDVGTPILQDKYGDTTYYMIGTDTLPVLMPLGQFGVPHPILSVLDAPLRVIIEQLGYDRTVSPGQPTPAGLIPFVNPINLAVSLVVSIPTGLDNGAQEAFGFRPFGTTPAGPYGVGGPPVTLPQQTTPGTPTPASLGAVASTAAATPDPTATAATTPDPTAAPTASPMAATNDPAPVNNSLSAFTAAAPALQDQPGKPAEDPNTGDAGTPAAEPKTKVTRPQTVGPATDVVDSVGSSLNSVIRPSSPSVKGDRTAKDGSAGSTASSGGQTSTGGTPGSGGA
jgi:hypothetical protein